MSSTRTAWRTAGMAATLLVMVGCAGQQDPASVSDAPSSYGEYETALKAGYKGLAEDERAEGDWGDSDFFVYRAQMSDSASPPLPQNVAERDLMPDAAAQLSAARERLMASHTPLARLKAPKELAQTQVAFDGWIQEQEENHQYGDIAEYRDRFSIALEALETRLAQRSDLVVVLPHADGSVGGVEVDDGTDKVLLDRALAAVETGSQEMRAFEIDTKEVTKRFGDTLAAQPIPPRNFTLYFQPNSLVLTAESEQVMAQMLADLAIRESPEIMVIGHTDRVGSQSYNDRLSRERATAIVTHLAEQGIDRDTMTAAGRGERELLVPTANSVAEPRNRRVELSVR